MTIGIYFVIIIFVMGTILAADEEISEEKRQKFFKDVLDAHNYHRKKHNAKPLKLDKDMCNKAQAFLEKYKTNPLEEYPKEYGVVNFHCKLDEPPLLNETPKLNGRRIIGWMYRKGNDYNYAIEPPLPEKTKNFTQIVWNNTEKLGVGVLIKNETFSLVLFYSPAGNIPKEYVKNVSDPGKPKKELPKDSSSGTKKT